MKTGVTTIAVYTWLNNRVEVYRGNKFHVYKYVTDASRQRISKLTYQQNLVQTGVLISHTGREVSVFLNVIGR